MAAPLKNHFDRALVELLAERFVADAAEFDATGFIERLIGAFPALELKDRINLVADELAAKLSDHYPTALASVVAVAETEAVDGFTAWPLCSFVERHGVDNPVESLAAMERLTRRFSCEFAIRPFLDHHLELTLASCRAWTRSDDETVRRLPSEGTRPYLPWGPKVTALLGNPEIGIELISALRHDPSETVRRSVANHLNDIARNHPDRVVELARQWTADHVDERMVRHALRSLVKKGNAGALDVLGFTTYAEISVEEFTITPSELRLGGDIELGAAFTSTGDSDQHLVIDFVVHHVGASGSATPKVFKWKTLTLAPSETVSIRKRRRIATASTRRYHTGVHKVDLMIAGHTVARAQFTLLDSSEAS